MATPGRGGRCTTNPGSRELHGGFFYVIAALPASGGTSRPWGGPIPLPAGRTVVISGADLEAREDKHLALMTGARSTWPGCSPGDLVASLQLEVNR